MPNKRAPPTILLEADHPDLNCEMYYSTQFCPRCYAIPQALQPDQAVIYNYDIHMDTYLPVYTSATFSGDTLSRMFYIYDIESPRSEHLYMLPYRTVNHHFEIAEMPHIEEDDYFDPPESPKNSFRGEYKSENCASRAYRSKEGYLVEEPEEENKK